MNEKGIRMDREKSDFGQQQLCVIYIVNFTLLIEMQVCP